MLPTSKSTYKYSKKRYRPKSYKSKNIKYNSKRLSLYTSGRITNSSNRLTPLVISTNVRLDNTGRCQFTIPTVGAHMTPYWEKHSLGFDRYIQRYMTIRFIPNQGPSAVNAHGSELLPGANNTYVIAQGPNSGTSYTCLVTKDMDSWGGYNLTLPDDKIYNTIFSKPGVNTFGPGVAWYRSYKHPYKGESDINTNINGITKDEIQWGSGVQVTNGVTASIPGRIKQVENYTSKYGCVKVLFLSGTPNTLVGRLVITYYCKFVGAVGFEDDFAIPSRAGAAAQNEMYDENN